MRWLPLLLIVLLAVAAALQIGRGPGATQAGRGAALYDRHCARCHAPDGSGRGPAPSLRERRWSDGELRQIIVAGRGRMRGVPQVRGAALDSLVAHCQSELR